MQKRFIIVSKEAGVFLGECLGFFFWSNLDAVGQDSAVTCSTKEEAEKLIKENPGAFPMTDLEVREVNVENLPWATMAECMAAGVPDWIDKM